MNLRFLGANRQVTGSCYLLEFTGKRLLIDCGLFQERRLLGRNWDSFPVSPASIDAVLLTHAHLDHCGRLPRLVSEGFRGSIYCTAPTVELADIVMRDSGRIQEEDATYKKKRHEREGRTGKHPAVPLYTEADAKKVTPMLKPLAFNACHRVLPDVEVCFHDAGHVLGSAMLTIDLKLNGQRRRLLMSGDIGQWDKPLIPDPSLIDAADYVVMESTYGDRDHPRKADNSDVEDALAEIINDAHERRGNVIIPTFAIERAQELLFHFSRLQNEKRIPRVPVFLDSPMAINVTEVFSRHRSFLDEETRWLLDAGEHPLDFPGLYLTRGHAQSKAINAVRGTAVILAGAGMCTGGRIKHHLVHNIWRDESTILFVGYQSPDTLGGQIVRGDKQVRIFGRMRDVNAQVRQISGLSAHADRTGLLRWIDALQRKPKQVFLTHGEEDVALTLADELRQSRQLNVEVPEYGSTSELI
jgi:metallo-beta-lactamase family protein